ncbi:hypothetical protein B0H67DRAFT_553885 [Lasiosphaeris hirsuta]|uniref:Uncharacterized protein n=1 Tax=Lasiosphaeris hirsuta TaxID=260670 RepID=A0AA40AGA7_9PEZI|nr:hypothetical protein B0H67DRAFT_553885 [Lasiosphaeris hirsuta]
MPALGRKPSWHQQLNHTKAKTRLLAGQFAQFPLSEVQRIASGLPKDKSPALWGRGIAPQSAECDILFASELAAVRGELAVHETAIVACLHLLSYEQARGQMFSIRPDLGVGDVFLEHKMAVYLQCVILARRANPDVCSEDERAAAEELLGVLRGGTKEFPSILRLLEAVGKETCELLLPAAMVVKVLETTHYQDNLARELEDLRRGRKWFDAYKLTYGLRRVVGLARADEMLRDVFPNYAMWAAWKPDFRRIASWESPNLTPHRTRLGPVLDLEGPDTTGQLRGTFRMSSPGAFSGLSNPMYSNDRHILDRLLEGLDASLTVGPATIDLLIALCIESGALSRHSLSQLEAAIELGDESCSETLGVFVRSLQPETGLAARMVAFNSALPLLSLYPNLQAPFGTNIHLERRAAETLAEAQGHLDDCRAEGWDNQPLGSILVAQRKRLLEATWLSGL